MFYKLSEQIADGFEKQRVISSEDKEIYRYGVQQGLNLAFNLLTTLVIGAVCGMFWESVLFMAAYMPLRSFAGGYHAKTHLRCYLYSILMITAVLLAIRFLPLSRMIYGCLMLAGSIVMIMLAPVEDQNKPLDDDEQRVYCKRTRLILSLEVGMMLAAILLQIKVFYSAVALAIFCLGCIVLAGELKNIIQKNRTADNG